MTTEMERRNVRGGEGSALGQEGNPPPMSRRVNLETVLINSELN